LSGELPPALRAAIEALAAGHPGRALAEAAARLSNDYRSGRGTRLAGAVDLAAYAVARMPATFAAVSAVLAEVASRTDFAPASLIDAGCGPATASWAALEVFDGLGAVTLVDAHDGMMGLARQLAAGRPLLAGSRFVKAGLERSLGEAGTADLVVAAYALNELPPGQIAAAAGRLYRASTGLTVIVEPGTPQGFAVIASARAALAATGGHVIAPCPHDGACPVTAPDWCHFSVRLPRLRAHRAAKGADVPFEDERHAYVAVARPGIAIHPASARVLRPPVAAKPGTTFRLCTAEGAADRFVPARDKTLSRLTRHTGWGDAFPEAPTGDAP
jgi:ribosomal protein RSM22 (predicted rRNA methylase)